MSPADDLRKSIFWREFFFLWAVGVGLTAISIFFVSLPPAGLARNLFIPLHTHSASLIIITLILQSSFQIGIEVGIGLLAANQVGLGAPILEAWLQDRPIRPHLRAPLIPIVFIVLLFMACTTFSNSSFFHPNRRQATAMANQMMDSPATSKMLQEMDKLGLVGSKPVTNLSMAISDLENAVGGGFNRLFEVSVISLLFMQVFGKPEEDKRWRYLLPAVLLIAVCRVAENVLLERENALLYLHIFENFGLPHLVDPTWLIVARTSMRLFPTALALGLLYVRYGLESSILASVLAAVSSHYFVVFCLTHFS
jgi:hypothetical protein